MKRAVLLAGLLTLCISLAGHAAQAVPTDVHQFMEQRDLCDHVRGEWPDSPDPARIKEINAEIAKYCSGTDKRLAALRKRYANDKAIGKALSGYDTSIEAGESTSHSR